MEILRVHFVPSILIASQKNNSKKERKNSPIHIIEMVNLKYPFFDIIPIIFLPKYRILIVRFKRSPPKDLETIYTSLKVSKVLAHNK